MTRAIRKAAEVAGLVIVIACCGVGGAVGAALLVIGVPAECLRIWGKK